MQGRPPGENLWARHQAFAESLNMAQVHDVQFSPSGNAILVAPGTNQARLYDRDGVET